MTQTATAPGQPPKLWEKRDAQAEQIQILFSRVAALTKEVADLRHRIHEVDMDGREASRIECETLAPYFEKVNAMYHLVFPRISEAYQEIDDILHRQKSSKT